MGIAELFLRKMKGLKFISFVMICFAAMTGFAQTAALEIISDPTLKQPFFLSINGVRQNESPTENILIKGLPFEAYGVELQLVSDPEPLRKVVFLRIGKTTNYLLSPASGKFKLTEGLGAEKPYNKQALVVNYKALEDTTGITETGTEQFADLAAPAINFDDEEESTTTTITPAQQAQKEPVKADPIKLKVDADSMFRSMREEIDREYNETPCEGAVTGETVRTLKLVMKDQKSLRDRYNTALRGIDKRCINIGQLKDLMRLLDGDELKVEFYKDIYKNISDIARRSDLFELFFFETSVEEIQKLQ